MKPEVAIKYLQYLQNKKNSDEGFTLIELLVVVIIIGVLAAVALPNLLNQVGKAREVEIQNAAGTVIRAQQAYHFEKQTMANNLGDLGISITSEYIDNTAAMVVTAGPNNTSVEPENLNSVNDGTRAYGASLDYNAGEYSQITCRSDAVQNNLPVAGAAAAKACPAGSTEVK